MVDVGVSKRKRDGSYERKVPINKDCRTRIRQEQMEQEFAETYHGLTALYKLLEIKHLQSPLFLPRTLSYRLKTVGHKKDLKNNSNSKVVKHALAGAIFKDLKIGMKPETMEVFKGQKHRFGILLSLYKANGRAFLENNYTLLTSCLTSVPCYKDLMLPKEFVLLDAEIYVLVFQVVDISDIGDAIASQSPIRFVAPQKALTVSGKNLLSTCFNERKPLFGNIMRISVSRRRVGFVTIEMPAIASSMHGGVRCEFYVSWDPLPKTRKMKRLASICDAKLNFDGKRKHIDENFALALPKRNVASADHKPCAGVWFHFLYHSMLRRMSEKRSEYSCAWCNMFAGSLRGLVAHLVSSHDRFRFQATVGHDNIPHIYVMVVPEIQFQTPTPGRRSAFFELETFPNEEPSRFEHRVTHVSGRKYGSCGSQAVDAVESLMQELNDIDELSEEKPQDFYAPLLQRQYFHSRTGAVVLDHEKDYDSDDDVDETWITKQSERLLDEFEDVSLEEKEFMKKWNRHVKEFNFWANLFVTNRILADFMVASSCRMFARKYGKWLLDHGLRHNFLLHLLNLWDNSLLNSRAIIDCMLIVDQNQISDAAPEEPEEKATSQTQAESQA
ncbi:hypothetical protein CCR75_004975 [Bremia lactucae]|uniref:Polycomb protein VEFS-Box domain-containing protein n=1 Tax=Bremia lactucae TaxID=4779 RepID=A0A976FQY1_BRELC|nr:hypothetical protein CCR75_004975 [Bremia lactucae]